MITRLEGRLPVDPDHASQLVELLDLLGEVLRHGGQGLRGDIADRFGPGPHGYLIDALDIHTGLLRRLTTTVHEGPPR